jgi:coiled-coil domain-containing protein 12
MSTTHVSLGAAADERKARLAKLRSLKRKQPSDNPAEDAEEPEEDRETTPDVTTLYLSGRNYDPETRGPKLGFEAPPVDDSQPTLETQATSIAAEAKKLADDEGKEANKGIDLFKLQPKKPNWDLKRDLDRKLEVLNRRTDNAIARLVRERIENQQKEKRKGTTGDLAEDDGNEMGTMEGRTLLGGVREREREDQEEERREREEDERLAMGDV